jgi:hypothetical protein
MKNMPVAKPISFVCRTTAALLCVLLFTQCRISKDPGAGSDPADLLPIDNDISLYLRKGSAAVMTDQQSIFNAIDGEAQKYIDYGFQEGVSQLYSNGSIDIDVQIFNQGTQENARDLYNLFLPSSSQQLNSFGVSVLALVDLSLPSGYQILYTKESILMRITTTEKTDIALNTAKQFCYNIDNKIGTE